MAKTNKDRIDPDWPPAPDGQYAVSELVADVQGASSPFGDTTFPIETDTLGYVHPESPRRGSPAEQ